MELLALDMSTTSVGYALRSAAGTVSGSLKPAKGVPSGWPRVRHMLEAVEDVATRLSPDRPRLVLIEGYSLGSKGNAIVTLGQLGGALRWMLDCHFLPWVEVPPATVKKYATGNGNAPKALMMVEAVKRLGYPGHDEDEVDALWLLHCGLAHYLPGEAAPVPKAHQAFLGKVKWPAL